MAICENCGKKYSPTAAAPDCPNCAEQEEEIIPSRRRARPAGQTATAPPRAAGRPSGGRAGSGRAPAPPAHHHHFQHPELLQKPGLDPIVKIGFGIAAGLLICTSVVYVVVKGKKDAENKAIQAIVDAKTSMMSKLRELNADSERDATEILKVADANKIHWENDADLRNEVQSMITRANATLAQSQQRRDAEAKLTGVEEGLKNPAGLTSENVREMQAKLAELEKLDIGTADFKKKIKDASKECGHLYATLLHDEAIAFSTSNASQPRLGLNRFYQAEEELKPMLDACYRPTKNDEEIAFYQPKYQEIVEMADKTAVQLFLGNNGEEIDKAAWIDLLSGQQANNWNPRKYQAVNGGLEIDGGAAGGKTEEVVSICDREQLRNFMFEIEFTVEAGSATVLFHLGNKLQSNTPIYALKTEGNDANVEVGRTRTARCAVVGDQFTWRFTDEQLGETKQEFRWTDARKGGIGFQVGPGSKLKLSKLRIKMLL